MRTAAEVAAWCQGAAAEFGDLSVPVCQLFFRWQSILAPRNTDDLVCTWADDELLLFLGDGFEPYPLLIVAGEPELAPNVLQAYGATRITRGVWALSPSFYPEGVIHAFVVLYDVPDPAPWEARGDNVSAGPRS